MESKIVYLDEKYVEHKDAKISVDDRGYLFSDGVYEVILVINKTLIDWELHCKRLKNSLAGLKIKYEVDESDLLSIITNLLDKNNLSNASIYLQITRGSAKRDHQFPSPDVKPSIYINANKFNQDALDEKRQKGLSAITYKDLRWKNRNYKTISLLPNVLAKQEAIERNCDEAILYEENKIVTEGSSTNVFIVDKNNKIFTHPANNLILNGITRIGVIQVAKENNFEISETAFSLDDLLNAKEIFISSTTKHVMPIVNLNNNKVNDGCVGDITRQLIEKYEKHVEKQYRKQ